MLFKSFKMFSIFLSKKKCRLKLCWLTSWWVAWLMNFYGFSLQTAGNEYRSSSILHGSPWSSITVHGTPSILQGTPWNSMKLQGQSMEFHGVTWNSVELHGIPWNSIDTPWNSMDTLWNSGIHGIPWNSMNTPWNSMKSMEFHGFPWRYFTQVVCSNNSSCE